MHTVITSGGTTEKIDDVRGISNFATGRLGKVTAEHFLAAGHQVTLLAGQGAALPAPHPKLEIITISDVASLVAAFERYLPRANALIHSMAVSDYSPIYMVPLEEVVDYPGDLADFTHKSRQVGKLSSAADYQVLFLKKTPKVIQMVKQLNPTIKLIAFKLLVGVDKADLMKAASDSFLKNQADYVLVNDLKHINDTQHLAYLVSQQTVQKARTKAEIAALLLAAVVKEDD